MVADHTSAVAVSEAVNNGGVLVHGIRESSACVPQLGVERTSLWEHRVPPVTLAVTFVWRLAAILKMSSEATLRDVVAGALVTRARTTRAEGSPCIHQISV